MAKRFTDTEKFKKRWIKELPIEYKLFWVYLLDHCNHAGVWDVEMDIANVRLGTNINEKEVIKIFKGKIISLDNGTKWFIPKFITFQYSELNENVKAHKSVIDILKRLSVWEQFSKGLESVLDKDMDKDKVKDKDIPPNLDLVLAYQSEIRGRIDPNSFIDFYASKGWMVGRNKMKDWKAAYRRACREWNKDEKTEIKNNRAREEYKHFNEV